MKDKPIWSKIFEVGDPNEPWYELGPEYDNPAIPEFPQEPPGEGRLTVDSKPFIKEKKGTEDDQTKCWLVPAPIPGNEERIKEFFSTFDEEHDKYMAKINAWKVKKRESRARRKRERAAYEASLKQSSVERSNRE
jgi:hypothetical protein